jgi:hypothetical protein
MSQYHNHHLRAPHFLVTVCFTGLIIYPFHAHAQPTPSASVVSSSDVPEKPKCQQCIPHYQQLSDGTQCELNQRWGSSNNFLCGPNSGLGCELDQYNNAMIPINVIFEYGGNGTAIKPECSFTYEIPTGTTANQTATHTSSPMPYTKTHNTGENCTGNFDISVRIVSPCYQHKLFEYGFDAHSLVTPCTPKGKLYCDKTTGKGAKKVTTQVLCSSNPQSRQLKIDIELDVYKYGEIAGPHARGVVNLFSAECSWIGGGAPEGLVVISDGTSRVKMSLNGSVLLWVWSLVFFVNAFFV